MFNFQLNVFIKTSHLDVQNINNWSYASNYRNKNKKDITVFQFYTPSKTGHYSAFLDTNILCFIWFEEFENIKQLTTFVNVVIGSYV